MYMFWRLVGISVVPVPQKNKKDIFLDSVAQWLVSRIRILINKG